LIGHTRLLGPPAWITAWVPECPTSEHNERLFVVAKVAVPAALWFEDSLQGIRELLGFVVSRLEIDQRPLDRLTGLHGLRSEAMRDLDDRQPHAFEHAADLQTLGDEHSCERHGVLLVVRSAISTSHMVDLAERSRN